MKPTIRSVRKRIRITCLCGRSWNFDSVMEKENLTCPFCNMKLSFGWEVKVLDRKSYLEPEERLERVLTYFDKKKINYTYYSDISDLDIIATRVLVADWKKVSTPMYRWLHTYIELDLYLDYPSDWDNCTICNNGIRIKPDCYGWQPSYIQTEHDRICYKCAEKDPKQIVAYARNSPDVQIPSWFVPTLKKVGFKQYKFSQPLVSGYNYANNSVKEVLSEVKDREGQDFEDQNDFIVVINKVEQFATRWSIWVKPVSKRPT